MSRLLTATGGTAVLVATLLVGPPQEGATAGPAPRRPAASAGAPVAGRPVPMPLVQPRPPRSVPIPLVEPTKRPVPMPLAQQPGEGVDVPPLQPGPG